MTKRARALAAPTFILACILIGGSTQGLWRVLALHLLAIGLIGWALLARDEEPVGKAGRHLLIFCALAILLAVLQLVPLPPQLWLALPGRESIALGQVSLGMDLAWLPWSMAPYQTLATAMTLVVPIAVIAVVLRLGTNPRALAACLLVGAFANILLGALQAAGGSTSTAWYLYENTNTGAVGFFANGNHMGTLLLAALPFTMALLTAGPPGRDKAARALPIVSAAGLTILVAGLALNRSLAAVLLAFPVIGISALLLPPDWRKRRLILVVAAVAIVAAAIAYASSPVLAELAGTQSKSFGERKDIWAQSFALLVATFPAGTGLGTFEQVYRLTEAPGDVMWIYVNHAHSDYLELLIETGLLGLAMIVSFLLWWLVQVVRIWRSGRGGLFARAATIASAAILLHSLVDFPLRTAAIAAVFAACIALMAWPARPIVKPGKRDLRPARHLVIG